MFFAKFTGNHLCRSLFLIKLQVSILQLHWSKELPYRCSLMIFARYLRHLFYRKPPGDCFCSTEKYFTNKIVMNPLRKETKRKQLVRKTTTHAEQNLNQYLHQVFISFYYSKIYFSLFLPMIYWKHKFLETMQSHWGFIYNRKLFLTFSLKKILFYSL